MKKTGLSVLALALMCSICIIPSAYAMTTEQGNHTTAQLIGIITGDSIQLSWNEIPDPAFQGYKVVVSDNNPAPKYPDDGFLFWITDRAQTAATVAAGMSYNGGDIGGSLQPGTEYFFSITAVYSDAKVPGNTLRLRIPGTVPTTTTSPPLHPVPAVTSTIVGDSVRLDWDAITDSRLQGYKVVISKSNPAPKYPDDGYMFYITDKNQHSVMINSATHYNGGDIGGYLKPGSIYYFSITAIYSDAKVPGNAVRLTFPGTVAITTTAPAVYPVPRVTGTIAGETVRLDWDVITDVRLQGYKVVVSTNNPAPKYPDDGYLFYITDRTKTTVTIDNSTSYNGGDIGGHLKPGVRYYFSITAVYSDKYVAGNAIDLVYPANPPDPIPPTPSPVITATPDPNETTLSINALIEEQNKKIEAQNKLIEEQNKKLAEQNNILDRLLDAIRKLFGIS